MLRLVLVGLCFLTGTALSIGSTTFAACLFLWNDIFRPMNYAHARDLFPAAYYVLFVLLASYVINLVRGKFKPLFGSFFIWFLILMAWLLITLAVSPFKTEGTLEFVRYLKYLLPLILIYTAMRGKDDIRMVSAVLSASVGIWAMQAGVIVLIQGVRIDLGIEGGQMSDRNDFTAAIVGTLPWFIYFFFFYKMKFKFLIRSGLLLGLFLALAAIVFSLSRGASLGLCMTGMCYIIFISKRKIRDITLSIVLFAAALLMLPQAWYDRMNTIEVSENQTEGSAKNRMILMKGAWQATLDRPIFGWGPDGWLQVARIYTNDDHSPHNIYLKVGSESGFPGLALYVSLMIMTLVRLKSLQSKAMAAKDKDSANLATAFAMSIIGLLTTMSFLNIPYNEYLWAWIVLANAFAERYRIQPRPKK